LEQCCPGRGFVVKYAAFIEPRAIPAPPHPQGFCFAGDTAPVPFVPLLLGGDDRAPSPDYGASSRGKQRVTVFPDVCADRPISDGYEEGVGLSKTYAYEAVDDGVLGDCYLEHAIGQEGAGSMYFAPERRGPSEAGGIFHGSPGFPLMAVVPHIDWTLNVMIDNANPAAPKYSIQGYHDGFPTHEVAIDGVLVYTYRPDYSRFLEPFALFGVGEIVVNCSGTWPGPCVPQ
jgi:hypothetical protein